MCQVISNTVRSLADHTGVTARQHNDTGDTNLPAQLGTPNTCLHTAVATVTSGMLCKHPQLLLLPRQAMLQSIHYAVVEPHFQANLTFNAPHKACP